MTEKKWAVVWPTTWQLLPIPLVWLGRNVFCLLSDLQLCGNFYYDAFHILLLFTMAILPFFFFSCCIVSLLRKKISFFAHIIVALLVLLLPAPRAYPDYRTPMLINNFYKNQNIYQEKVNEIIKSNVFTESDCFTYYTDNATECDELCYSGFNAFRSGSEIFILLPVDIHNDASMFSYFQGFLYSKTGHYPESIFPPDKIEMMKKLNDHWYMVYQYPWIKPRLY